MQSNYSPLLTDFYQLTMAYGYFTLGKHLDQATFEYFFRQNPFKGNYVISAGLEVLSNYLSSWKFDEGDLTYLSTLKTPKGKRFFSHEFLDYLSTLRFAGTLEAMTEGTISFANIPQIRIEGPLIQCQLIESFLLNIMNFQTLIATKASRIYQTIGSGDLLEFGLRRAQGPNGALSASRAAYIGGACATSNTLAGKYYGIPLRGTISHSWISSFDNEIDAFEGYVKVLPDNGVLLVDTYDTLTGVCNAIEVGKKLRHQGFDLLAVRLDSGAMVDLSQKTRVLLDEAGFIDTKIIASNTLDEYIIEDLKLNQAKIDAYGVGTRLVTAYDQPALDGVYKLTALKSAAGKWCYKFKKSEQQEKTTLAGRHQVRRYFLNNTYITDVIYDLSLGITDVPEVYCNTKQGYKKIDDYDAYVDLLVPIFKNGKLIYHFDSLDAIRSKSIAEMKIFTNAHGDSQYPIGVEKKLYQLQKALISKII